MFFTKYGLDVLIIIVLIFTLIIIISNIYLKSSILKYGITIISFLIIIFTLYFFRDPDRTIPVGEYLILAPADGKIILAKDVYEDVFLKEDAIMISIFMSPFNVHVNRSPISGIIKYYKHIPGKYLVAFEEKSSDVNERTLIGIENGDKRILLKQIAGILARRIVAEVKVDSSVRAGERFGMIKFGSRVDLYIQKSRARVLVNLNDKVTAGETIIAEFIE